MNLITKISGIEQLDRNVENRLTQVSSIEYVILESDKDVKEALQNCDVFWFRLNHKLTREILKTARCKYILCAVTGLDHIDLKACEEFGITVISLKNEFEFLKEVRATAEHTWGLLLTLIRKTDKAITHVENGIWDRTLFQGSELYKKKIGILGLGRLGEIVAGYAHAFGMQVFYFDTKEKQTSKHFKKCDTVKEMLQEVDVLSIHLPYNEENHEIIDTSYFETMKKGMLIVNTSRGGLILEEDLVNSMQNNIVSGYASDVLFGEPEITTNPIFQYAKKHKNIILTPHIGGNTHESIEKTEEFILEKFLKFLS
ncbi:NAD(P)-dependent oxidoreductase [Aureivirga sp. CE67]|uniref:NAD(P)-dependent oxidoreductase n=1 Tax=Aureivirga sp. CE67 TaxID=1788983 RepID=UPI0018CBD8F4|nr:D-isomer specific 2-hydroxyacid dehydrogenase family protein [Aureivirga sp. CE67]